LKIDRGGLTGFTFGRTPQSLRKPFARSGQSLSEIASGLLQKGAVNLSSLTGGSTGWQTGGLRETSLVGDTAAFSCRVDRRDPD
jgi:hypothetical protein